MSLSERIRPDCEAAPWVCEEVKELERELAEMKSAIGDVSDWLNNSDGAVKKLREERDQWREVAHELEDLVDWSSWGWLGKTKLIHDKFHRLKEASRE